MIGHRRGRRTFFSAPQSVTGLVAALLEPAVIVGCYFAINHAFGQSALRADLVLGLLVLALTFPGRNRFRDARLTAAVDILIGWSVLLGLLALCGLATGSFGLFDRRVLLAWAIVTPFVQWTAVLAGRRVVAWRARRPGARRTAVVIGATALGVRVAKALQASGSHGSEFIGFFDDRTDARVVDEARPRLLDDLTAAAAYVRAHAVREVYITLPLGSQPRIVALLESLQGTTASLFYVPDVFGISIIQGRLEDVAGVPVVGICETPFTGINALAKRTMDLLLAGAIVAAASPLLLLLAIGVRLSSPGPVIFRQHRIGLDGERITVWKFRSMTTQDDGAQIRQATHDDPRVTRFGRFLRRTSLDELPQLFNVLQGRMSIVGPRPHAVAHDEQYRRLIKAYMVRHKVRPGITGWAQIHGQRGETSTLEDMQRRVEYDLEYLRNWSIALDLQIIARTVKLVFFDPHAY
jgi:putative colanic acid biosynthesis UDP-glucose lipid carrier transferase